MAVPKRNGVTGRYGIKPKEVIIKLKGKGDLHAILNSPEIAEACGFKAFTHKMIRLGYNRDEPRIAVLADHNNRLITYSSETVASFICRKINEKAITYHRTTLST